MIYRLFYCKLLERLLMKEIVGINMKPKTSGACLVNIRKATSLIKDKPE